jgi:hypothetical protein
MKTQLVITDADPIFLAALIETMAAMQAEKDQGDETENFVGRFPDFEPTDLEYIRGKADEVLATRAGIPDAESYSTSTSTRSETVLPDFRYFRNPEGDEWKMPVNGEKGCVRERWKMQWDTSCSKLANFVDESGAVAGHYMEFFPVATIAHAGSDQFRSLLARGLSLVGDAEYSEDGSAWIAEAEAFLSFYGITPATIHVPSEQTPGLSKPGVIVGALDTSGLADAFGHPVADHAEAATMQADQAAS